MKCLIVLAAFVVLATCSLGALAQAGKPLYVALPYPSDLKGFVKHHLGKGSDVSAGMGAFRGTDMLRLEVGIRFFGSPEQARQLPVEYNKMVQSAHGGLKRGDVGSVPCQELWSDRQGKGPFRMIAIDGRCAVEILIAPGFVKNDKGYPHQRAHTTGDVALAKRLLTETLDRLTVLGRTSRPASAASETARRQVQDRS